MQADFEKKSYSTGEGPASAGTNRRKLLKNEELYPGGGVRF